MGQDRYRRNNMLLLPESGNDRIERSQGIDLVPDDSYGRASGQYSSSPAGRYSDYNTFKFKDLIKKTKEAFDAHLKSKRHIYAEQQGGVVKVGQVLLGGLKKAVGARVRTLEDLFAEEERCVYEVCQMLSGLYSVCEEHYSGLVDFRQRSNTQLQSISDKQPFLNRNVTESRREYDVLRREFERMSRGHPRFYETSERLSQLRDAMNHSAAVSNVSSSYAGVVDNLTLQVDSVVELLAHGKDVVGEMLVHYDLALNYHRQVLPGVNFTRELMNNLGMISSMHTQISSSFSHANKAVQAFENPLLLVNACRTFPGLRYQDGMAGVLDRLNEDIGAGRMNALLRR